MPTPTSRLKLSIFIVGVVMALFALTTIATAQAQPRDFDCSTVTDIPQTECEALISLYNSTNGAGWTDSTNWLSSTSACSWFGITCAGNNVMQIYLYDNNLTGTLPALSGLPEMIDFTVAENNIGGAIPTSFNGTNFPILTGFNVSGNALTGEVPTSLTTFPQLTNLSISGNTLSGPLIDLSPLCDTLTQLYLWGNNFGGTWPSWLNGTTCDSIEYLEMSYLGMTGAFPDLTGMSLKMIAVSGNNFTETITPSWLTNMPTLEYVTLEKANLIGTIPVFASTNLNGIFIGGNKFTGNLPAAYNATNYPNLLGLGIQGLQIENLHNDFTTLNLNFLSIGYNKLNPDTLNPSVVTYLDEKSLHWEDSQALAPDYSVSALNSSTILVQGTGINVLTSGFSGVYEVLTSSTPGGPYTLQTTIPGYLGSFSIQLTGQISASTVYVVLRSRIDPHINNPNQLFSAYGPEYTVILPEYTAIDCLNTGLTGIPQAECNWLVDLYNTTDGGGWTTKIGWMEGPSPCNWYGITCNGGHVTHISLINNALVGPIPDFIDLPNLTYLSLALNLLTGEFPASLASHPTVAFVNLSSNSLSGSIPDLSGMSSVTDLYLGGNYFTGNFPTGLANKTTLNRLYLDFNQFSGTLPDLSGMTGLLVFQVYGNQFSGTLPTLPTTNLVFFGASGNQFSGEIPASYGDLINLTGLALDANNLSGEIPVGIGDLPNLGVGSVLSYVGFSYNKLTATDSDVIDLLAVEDPDFGATQTVPVTNLAVGTVTDHTVPLTWTPISYIGHTGYYEVGYRVGTSGVYTFSVSNRTADKTGTGLTVSGLIGDTEYCFVVRSVTLSHTADNSPFTDNQSTLTSNDSVEVCGTTTGSSTPTVKPAATLLTSPTNRQSITGTKSPVLVWEENAAADQVTTYKVTLKDNASGTTVLNKNYAASAVCDAGICQVNLGTISPVVALSTGTYNWQLTATNVVGGTKSAKFLFTITKPSKPGLISPIGNTTLSDPFPSLYFEITDGQALTSLKVTLNKTGSASPVFSTTFLNLAEVCTGVSCSLPITTPLSNGSYTWTVQAKNVNGSNTSTVGAFKIAYPSKAFNLAPTGNATVNALQPTFTWGEVIEANEYRVTIKHVASGTKVILGWQSPGGNGLSCDNGVCAFNMQEYSGAPNLKKGAHDWFVEARDTLTIAASKSKSAIAKFKVVLTLRDDSAESLPLPPDGFRTP